MNTSSFQKASKRVQKGISSHIIVLKKHNSSISADQLYLSSPEKQLENNSSIQEENDLENKGNIYFDEYSDSIENIFEILQPFKNFALLPCGLKKKIEMMGDINKEQLNQLILELKTPQDSLGHQKKIEKLKLLVLGQETMIKNYLKERSSNTKNPAFLHEYMNYINSKLFLTSKMNEVIQALKESDDKENFCYQTSLKKNDEKIHRINDPNEYIPWQNSNHCDDYPNWLEFSTFF